MRGREVEDGGGGGFWGWGFVIVVGVGLTAFQFFFFFFFIYISPRAPPPPHQFLPRSCLVVVVGQEGQARSWRIARSMILWKMVVGMGWGHVHVTCPVCIKRRISGWGVVGMVWSGWGFLFFICSLVSMAFRGCGSPVGCP